MLKTKTNLVPDIVNTSPDYYCTWQTQLYASNNLGVQAQRDIMTENFIFDNTFPNGCADFFRDARRDLIFVLDDSWDVPLGAEPKKSDMFGSLILNDERFPSYANQNTENKVAMKKLSDDLKKKGWKGVGGWVCAQKAPRYNDICTEEYYCIRLKEADFAGWLYWKVDWGSQAHKKEYRLLITNFAHKFATNLSINNAIIKEIIPQCDVYRTYDVPAIMSIPMKMDKLSRDLAYDAAEDYRALIDCEDEVYLAVALGCTFGVMRHPMQGNLPSGAPDSSFPNLHRNIKTKIDEVTRAVRWHRVAPAFSVNGSDTYISQNILTDTWYVENQAEEIEDWWKFVDGDVIEKSAPAIISRGIALPTVIPDMNGDTPFVVAAKNPNGAVSVATLGRTKHRDWTNPLCDIVIDAKNATLFGVFGYYSSLEIHTSAVNLNSRIFAQDLLTDFAFDITDDVDIVGGCIKISGELITEIGTYGATQGDTSEPGMILRII